MKKGFYSLMIILTIILFSDANAQTKELAKPIENKAVKKAETVTIVGETNQTTSSSTSSGDSKKGEIESTARITKVINVNPENATRDSENYQTLKTDWIKNNPEKYKQLSGNPNLVIITEAELLLLPAEDQSRILADEENYLIIRQ